MIIGLSMSVLAVLMFGGFRFEVRKQKRLFVFLGFISGSMGTLTGVNGPQIILGLTNQGYSASYIRSFIITYLILIDTVTLLAFISFGYVKLATIINFTFMAPLIVASYLVGKKILKRMKGESLKKAMLIAVLISSAILAVRYGGGLIADRFYDLCDRFTFSSVKRVIFGCNALKTLTTEISRLGGRKVAIIMDRALTKILAEKVSDLLTNIEHEVWSKVTAEPEISTVDRFLNDMEGLSLDTIIGIGGGSSLDTAKLAASIAFESRSQSRKAEEFINSELPERKVKLILCPTTARTGSEETKLAVFRVKGREVKYVFDHDSLYADTAIVDPLLTLTLPKSVTADSGIDAICHAIEAYTSVYSSPISDMFALEAIKTASRALREVYANGENIKARVEMSYAALAAGISFNNVGTSLAHALGYAHTHIHGSSHGRSVGITMPYVLQYNAIANIRKHAKIADFLGKVSMGWF